jgi:hypothetical protein
VAKSIARTEAPAIVFDDADLGHGDWSAGDLRRADS